MLFYSTTTGTNTSIASCCQFFNAYNLNPTSSPITLTNDGSYALHLPVGDLAPGASRSITWYYAAGQLADLAEVIQDVADAASPPAVPAATHGNGSVDVTWVAPSSQDPITGYRIRWSTDDGATWSAPIDAGLPTPLSYTVTGLANGATYQFQVAAVTGADETLTVGEWSASSTAVMPGSPARDGVPTIIGDPVVGAVLAVIDPDDAWTNHGDDELIAWYQWKLGAHEIDGATGPTLLVTPDMVGAQISVDVGRTNEFASFAVPSDPIHISQVRLLTLELTRPGAGDGDDPIAVDLVPAFTAAPVSRTASVANAVTSVTVGVTAPNGSAVTVNGAAPVDGLVVVPLAVGANQIEVVVTDGVSVTYPIVVTRAAPPPPPPPPPTTTTPPATTVPPPVRVVLPPPPPTTAPPATVPGAPTTTVPGTPTTVPPPVVTPVDLPGTPIQMLITDLQPTGSAPAVVVEPLPPSANDPHKERGIIAATLRYGIRVEDLTFQSVELCLKFDPDAVGDLETASDRIRLLHTHLDVERDITSRIDLGTDPPSVCGATTHFSDFQVAVYGSQRVAGSDRYATAAAAALSTHGRGAEIVYVASGERFADTVVAGAAAASAGAPLLLVRHDSVPSASRDALDELAPQQIVIVGGAAVVSAEVEALLGGVAPVVRLAGDDRHGTSARVALDAHPGGVRTVYLATGDDFADPLVAGSAAALDGAALLLTERYSLPEVVAEALTRLDPERVIVIGGPAAIDPSVTDAVRSLLPAAAIERIGGADRYATAVAIAERFPSSDHPVAVIATGTDFADAAAAVPLAVRQGSTVLLVRPDQVSRVVDELLATISPQGAIVVGGFAAIGAQAELTIVRRLPARVPAPL